MRQTGAGAVRYPLPRDEPSPQSSRSYRRAARVLALGRPPSLVTSAAGTAFADAPDSWENSPAVSALHVAPGARRSSRVGLFLLITLLVYLPSMSRGEQPPAGPGVAGRGGVVRRAARRARRRSTRRSAAGSAPTASPDRPEEAQVAAGDAFTPAQRHEIDKAIRDAETVCRIEFSVFVGRSEGETRPFAERLHATLVAPDRSVLVLVDPAARLLEIVTGAEARRVLDDAEVELAALTMQTAFAAATSSAASPGACSSSPSTPAARSCARLTHRARTTGRAHGCGPRRAEPAQASAACAASARSMSSRASRT